jgi:hypothetical protein
MLPLSESMFRLEDPILPAAMATTEDDERVATEQNVPNFPGVVEGSGQTVNPSGSRDVSWIAPNHGRRCAADL